MFRLKALIDCTDGSLTIDKGDIITVEALDNWNLTMFDLDFDYYLDDEGLFNENIEIVKSFLEAKFPTLKGED